MSFGHDHISGSCQYFVFLIKNCSIKIDILFIFRPFIPPRQRHRFDDFIKENEVLHNSNEDDASPGSQKNSVKMLVIFVLPSTNATKC